MTLSLLLDAILNAHAEEHLQRICCMFLAALAKFQETVPTNYFAEVVDEITSTFFVHILSIFTPTYPNYFFKDLWLHMSMTYVSDVSTTSATGFCTDMPIPIFSICFSRACHLVIFLESTSLRTMLANSARRPCENSYFPQLLSCLLRSGWGRQGCQSGGASRRINGPTWWLMMDIIIEHCFSHDFSCAVWICIDYIFSTTRLQARSGASPNDVGTDRIVSCQRLVRTQELGRQVEGLCSPTGWGFQINTFISIFLTSLQGGLDMHYLNNRFETGKEKVKNYMEKHHSFTCYKTLTLAQGDIVEKQAALGKSAFLDVCSTLFYWSKS